MHIVYVVTFASMKKLLMAVINTLMLLIELFVATMTLENAIYNVHIDVVLTERRTYEEVGGLQCGV